MVLKIVRQNYHPMNLIMQFARLSVAVAFSAKVLAHGGIYSYHIGDKVYQG